MKIYEILKNKHEKSSRSYGAQYNKRQWYLGKTWWKYSTSKHSAGGLCLLTSSYFSLFISIMLINLVEARNNYSIWKSNFFENEVADRTPLYWCGFLILCTRHEPPLFKRSIDNMHEAISSSSINFYLIDIIPRTLL